MPGYDVLVIQLAASDPPGRLADWLAEAGARVRLCDLSAGDRLPADLTGVDGLVVLGTSLSVHDDDQLPALAPLRALLRAAVSDEVPTLGICFGGQLLAHAHGGTVEPNPGGPEIGSGLVAKRSAAAADPLFGPLPITPDVIQWHFDAITRLPAGAVQLASGAICENQAYRLGRLAWGLQFHIETTPQTLRSWAAEDAAALEDIDVDLLLQRSDAAHEDVAEVWRPFVAQFVAVMAHPEQVRAPRVMPTTTAAPVTDPAAIRAALATEAQAARQPVPDPTALPMPGLRPPEHG